MFSKLLHNRALVIIGAAESVSGIGNWITMMAVFALVVFRGDGSVAQSSGIFLAGLLPSLLVSPLLGALIDRYDRKHLMIAGELLSGVFVAGLIFVERLEWIYVLLALQAVTISLMTPARQAVVPDLVAPGELTRANAFLQQLAGLIKIGSPILAGAILALLNPHTAIVLDVISFALSALILSRLPTLPPHRVARGKTDKTPVAPRPAVLTVLKESTGLRLLFSMMFMAIFVIIGFDVLSSIFVRDVLQSDESLYGLLIGLVGLGTVVAAGSLLLRRRESDPWRDVLMGLGLLALIPASLALAAAMHDTTAARVVVSLAALAGGVGNGLLTVQIATLLQVLAPAELLGRLSGIFQSTTVAGQLTGILLAPLLVPALLSIGTYFALSTVALALVILYGLWTLARGNVATFERVNVPHGPRG